MNGAVGEKMLNFPDSQHDMSPLLPPTKKVLKMINRLVFQVSVCIVFSLFQVLGFTLTEIGSIDFTVPHCIAPRLIEHRSPFEHVCHADDGRHLPPGQIAVEALGVLQHVCHAGDCLKKDQSVSSIRLKINIESFKIT